ncbi:Tn3 family transposase, partial [Janthinobacterium sp. ROICE36]|uniref:Tn3 family transposase n=1 Tax=Janthinobacterium sp. ROICE36 TaxID=2048670 RepID=UPI0011AEEDCA
ASRPTFALNSAVCTRRFLPSLICCHPFTDHSLNHRLRFGIHYTLKEMQGEGLPINEEILAGLAPYRTEHINRYGDYTLDLERIVPPMNYRTRILQ